MTQSRIASFMASLSVREPRLDRHDLGAQQAHAGHVERLAARRPRCPCRRRIPGRAAAQAVAVATPCWPAPVSAITRALAHAPREQRLAERVVDLVGAGVVEVLALEVDLRAASARSAARRGRAASAGRRSRRAGARARPGSRVVARLLVGRVELVERRDERLGDEPAAVGSEASSRRSRT